MRIHFIAIGGSVMHDLAITLHTQGHEVSGSDDELFEPARSRLNEHGLLPPSVGWDPERVTPDIDMVILGMHAHTDNPELIRAQELDLPVRSYPAFLYGSTRDKKRVVIGGSHGKTTITTMVLHVLHMNGISCDYLVGARPDAETRSVELNEKNRIAVFEGDEYLSSRLDQRPKFHVYQPHIGVISGIAWDHINVFPTYTEYLDQFRHFIQLIPSGGRLIWAAEEPEVKKLLHETECAGESIPYWTHKARSAENRTLLLTPSGEVPVNVFGDHNLRNLNAARLVCREMGVSDEAFYESIKTFKGTAKRLELIGENDATSVYKDYAHSPSKLKATTKALRHHHPQRRLVACIELHTYSSLNEEFLDLYGGTMDPVDRPIVFYDPATLEQKRLPPITPERIKAAFQHPMLEIYTKKDALKERLLEMDWKESDLLMMSSGNFRGLDLEELAEQLLNQ